ncbi:H(+)/Cl(-) exchange transporter 5 [Colletotrichum spaethianum]|uniref:H(+)/Cl(-) exchange transporter 5 n=1 Tax=Colletotrichum spaethianum TaxID=700344 RepID=A0AA37L8A4_9PEZI|nr:H(+)/Cl(-) exchange transporter 5 [Colletotrichum spaethianum]GKT43871.1 H(+)/Cl(-) exchange transporter 5 [Colletotrichum spaethianum]
MADQPDDDMPSGPPSPMSTRRPRFNRKASDLQPDERSPLLTSSRSRIRRQPSSTPESPKHPSGLSRNHSAAGSIRSVLHHSRNHSFGQRLSYAISDYPDPMSESKRSILPNERVWYDQFTSTDWVHDNIVDAHRVKALKMRKDFWGRVYAIFDASQGWILSAVCGFVVALVAYVVNLSEATVFDYKYGYCARGWYISEKNCCPKGAECEDWLKWSDVLKFKPFGEVGTSFVIYLVGVVVLSLVACAMTLTTRTVVPSAYRMTTFDENLAAELAPYVDDPPSDNSHGPQEVTPAVEAVDANVPPPMVYYSAAGSGVAEVRVILSGFVLHGFLGVKTMAIKSAALILSVASGMSLGKEGPYVHIATCVGNIACRLFTKYDSNDAKRREVLSAAAAAGVAVAFGAPLGGVLFGLEEVSYFFPAKTLFRTFFCCIVAALSLKFLNPYGTHKIVMFQVKYVEDWHYFEIAFFILIGVLGGAAGALFIKASKFWAKSFRRIKVIKAYPMLEVLLVAVVTAFMSYWNVHTKQPVAKLMLNLAAPCRDGTDREDFGLCPTTVESISPVVLSLFWAFLIKGFLTIITFGIKVPAGIYVPSMVVGGLMGRMVGHAVQYIVLIYPDFGLWGACASRAVGSCIQPGVYGLIAAGSTMCGVTRLSVTLAVILFELTGSLDYVLPFSLAILVAKWTADAIEPNSIYDLLTSMNSYPFLDNKHKPIFTSDLADIVPRVRRERIIDISASPMVSATSLRTKLQTLHRAGEIDGGLPIIRDGILVGLIPAPDLEFALDNLDDEDNSMCLMAHVPTIEDSDDEGETDKTDFTPYIDPVRTNGRQLQVAEANVGKQAPVALDIRSPMDLVYECFVKLGLRCVCVLKNGRYAGLVHKKSFVKYMRELEEKEGH